MRTIHSVTMCALVALGALPAAGQQVVSAPPATDPSLLNVVQLTVTPSAEARPALRWRLLPALLDQTIGDAAPLYWKACLVLAERKVEYQTWEQLDKWREMPLAKLPRDEVRNALKPFDPALDLVELAAHRTQCNWVSEMRDTDSTF